MGSNSWNDRAFVARSDSRTTATTERLEETSPFRQPPSPTAVANVNYVASEEIELVGFVFDRSEGEHHVAFCGHATLREFTGTGDVCRMAYGGKPGCRAWQAAMREQQAASAASAAAQPIPAE